MGACFGSEGQSSGGISSNAPVRGGDENDAVSFIFQSSNMCQPDLSNQVQLHISCSSLPKMDITSKSDPFAVVYIKNKNSAVWSELGKTEKIKDNSDPVFVKSINALFMFEERQPLKIEVYDSDDTSHIDNLSKHDFIGSIELFMHEIVRAEKQTVTKNLHNPKKKNSGSITVFADQIDKSGSSDMVKMLVEGSNFPKNNIFLQFSRAKDSQNLNEFIPIFQTETCQKRQGIFRFKMINVSAYSLMKDDPNFIVKVEVMEKKRYDSKLIDSKVVPFQEILSKPIWNMNGGNLEFKIVEIEKRNSFLDYIFGGCGISLMIAIDYTASNGAPSTPNSLHYLDLNRNQYIQAIQAVGGILECYDSDKMIPTFGFGGYSQPTMPSTSHCFALNGNIFNPEIYTIQGVVEAYKSSLTKIQLSGPTNFEEIIQYCRRMVKHYLDTNYTNQQNYFILLILTDGAISDFQRTANQIVRASGLPMSIVIVGVGSADFSEMERLDADDNPLRDSKSGNLMARDIVQFVPFQQYKTNPQLLAKQVLGEIPKQLVDFMTKHDYKPSVPTGMNAGFQAEVSYFAKKCGKFKEKLISDGCDPILVDDIINKGFPCMDRNYFKKNLRPNYSNPFIGNAVPQY